MKTLLNAINEKDVENIYRSALIRTLTRANKDAEITSPYGVDGLLRFGGNKKRKTHVLLEFKYDDDLKSSLTQAKIYAQCIYYLKKFHESGERVPQALFIGDKNECFVLESAIFEKFLFRTDIDWSIAPSQAYKNNILIRELIDMIDSGKISPFVFDIDDDFKFSEIVNKITEIGDEAERIKIKITPRTLERVFRYFEENVIKEKKDKFSPNERANLFVQLITNPQENYLHPKKRNILSTKAFGYVRIDSKQFRSFFGYFDGENYSPRQKEALTSSVDRIVEDITRRSKGEFFTPTEFVDLAHDYITKQYGDDWKERFVVWDCASGTMNLTRDYKFKELYCSTLEASDLETAEQHGYNPEAVKFQYDFLNDGPEKLPQGLRDAIEQGKEILFLINPPYATPTNMGANTTHKAGIANTAIAQQMKEEKTWGAVTQSIQAQFLYRIHRLQKKHKNIHLAIFCTPVYMTGGSYEKFRDQFFNDFKYDSGFLFQASHFVDVKGQWGINFAIMSPGKHIGNVFDHDIIDVEGAYLVKVGDKSLYSTDGRVRMSQWYRNPIKGLKTLDEPQMTNSINVKDKGYGKSLKNSYGYFYSNSNSVYHNATNVALFSSAFSGGHGVGIIKSNFKHSIMAFAARKLVDVNWLNNKDEYLAPNENHPEFDQFYYDSIVYSLFNNSSQQSSLRQIDYKGKKWDIKNEFFWMGREKILEFAEEHNFDEIYQDSKFDKDRYVHNLLFGEEKIYDKLSPDAREVLDMATNLMEKSFDMRKIVSEEHPEYHLNSWDAGYAQMKLVWKDYFPEEFKDFRDKYKEFNDRLVPMVYELGFLLKETK